MKRKGIFDDYREHEQANNNNNKSLCQSLCIRDLKEDEIKWIDSFFMNNFYFDIKLSLTICSNNIITDENRILFAQNKLEEIDEELKLSTSLTNSNDDNSNKVETLKELKKSRSTRETILMHAFELKNQSLQERQALLQKEDSFLNCQVPGKR